MILLMPAWMMMPYGETEIMLRYTVMNDNINSQPDNQSESRLNLDCEDATLMAEADFLAEGLGKGPTFATDGIFLSERVLAEIKSNPSKFFEGRMEHDGVTP